MMNSNMIQAENTKQKLRKNQNILKDEKEIRLQKKRLIRLIKYIHFNGNDIVGDFGCGIGLLLDLITKRINFYYGIDISEESINLAIKHQKENSISNAEFQCGIITDFCKNKTNLFDKAFAMDLTEHINDDKFISIFTSIRNSLKNSGTLYIHTPNGDYLLELLKKQGVMKQFPEHIAVRNDKDYIRLLKQIGYTSINIRYLPHYINYLSFLHFLSYVPLIGKYFKARLFIECIK